MQKIQKYEQLKSTLDITFSPFHSAERIKAVTFIAQSESSEEGSD
jgi:hypothetical protein